MSFGFLEGALLSQECHLADLKEPHLSLILVQIVVAAQSFPRIQQSHLLWSTDDGVGWLSERRQESASRKMATSRIDQCIPVAAAASQG